MEKIKNTTETKKEFTFPVLEIIELGNEDIIQTSDASFMGLDDEFE